MRNLFPKITLFLAIFGFLSVAPLLAQTGSNSQADRKPLEVQPEVIEIEFFEALEKGYVEYSIIPRNSLNSRLTVVNKTDKRLDIAMPNAFAAIPASVVAQFDSYSSGSSSRNNSSGNNRNNNNNSGGNQSYGGGNNNNNNNNRNSNRNNNWSIPPEKVMRQDLLTVCLEHGKKEPNPRVKYEMRPMSVFTDNLETAILCEKLSAGELEQSAVQAAVWHIENGMSWDELTNKTLKQPGKRPVPYFQSQQIADAKYMVEASQQLARKIVAQQKALAESMAEEASTFDPSRSMTEQDSIDD